MMNLFRKRSPAGQVDPAPAQPAPELDLETMTAADVRAQIEAEMRPPTLEEALAEANRVRFAAKAAYDAAASEHAGLENHLGNSVARAAQAITPKMMGGVSMDGLNDLERRIKHAEIVKRRAEVAWRRACTRCQALERERGRRRAAGVREMIAKRDATKNAEREALGLPPHGATAEHLDPLADLVAAYSQTQHGPAAPARGETFLGMPITRSA